MQLAILLRKARTFGQIIIGSIKFHFVMKGLKKPKVLSIEETINNIINNHLSVARLGDGEFNLAADISIGLQKADPKLRDTMREIIKNNNPNLLVCIAESYENLDFMTLYAKLSLKMFHSKTYRSYYSYINFSKVYGNSFFTRPYMIYKDKSECAKRFTLAKRIWQDIDIIIFEGEKTRFGVGNDLFDNTKSVKRILCPPKHAFNVYDQILAEARTLDKNNLLLFALGATATLAAYDLTKDGYRVIDIGNLDVEYSWFLLNAKAKVPLKGKSVSEVVGGMDVEDINDTVYQSQIIGRIGLN